MDSALKNGIVYKLKFSSVPSAAKVGNFQLQFLTLDTVKNADEILVKVRKKILR